MKVLLLANHYSAIPAMDQLARRGMLSGVAIPALDHDSADRIRHWTAQSRITLHVIDKTGQNETLSAAIRSSGAEVVYTVSWPFVIGRGLLKQVEYGFVNFHYGRLPEYRGSDPVFWTIRNGDMQGAVSVHRMDGGMDTGPLLHIEPVPSGPGMIHGRLMALCGMVTGQLMSWLPDAIEEGRLKAQPQSRQGAKSWPRPGIQELMVDWRKMNAAQVSALVKAGNPWNRGAFTTLMGGPIRLTEVTDLNQPAPEGAAAGAVIRCDAEAGLIVACAGGTAARIDILCPDEGFLTGAQAAGLGLKPGMQFGS